MLILHTRSRMLGLPSLDVGLSRSRHFGRESRPDRPQGRTLAAASAEYHTHQFSEGGTKQDSADWVHAVRAAITRALPPMA